MDEKEKERKKEEENIDPQGAQVIRTPTALDD